MKIVSPQFTIEHAPENAYEVIERIGRTCYKSEDRIAPGTAEKFVRMLRDRGHTAMFDHISCGVRFICDRGVSHELVRHRIAAYAQESTRYCNYGKNDQVTFVKPVFWNSDEQCYLLWLQSMLDSERTYLAMLNAGATPEKARTVLPNSLKTEIIATLDFTAWRHVFKLRTSKAAHPQMREIMIPTLEEFTRRWPACFDDIKAVSP